MYFGCPARIDGDCAMPELAVKPFKRKGFFQIIVAEFINVACNMKRLPWPGVKTYVKMNFQIFV